MERIRAARAILKLVSANASKNMSGKTVTMVMGLRETPASGASRSTILP